MKIISGGQTGVDRAALDVALKYRIECGGWCPAGRLDEFGHIPIIVWLDVYQRFKLQFKEPFVIVTGQVSRRDGTFNLIAQKARTFKGNVKPPPAKSWR